MHIVNLSYKGSSTTCSDKETENKQGTVEVLMFDSNEEEERMAIEKKETVKSTETKTAKAETPKAVAPAATEETKVVEKKAAAPKKAAVPKAAAPKAAVEKKAAAPKAAAEKKVADPKAVVKKDPKTKVVVEFAGKQIVTKDIVAAATKAFNKANKGVTIKSIEVYVKPEEHVAYYVVNGQGADEYKVNL